MIAHRGEVLAAEAVGDAVRYAAGDGAPLPPARRVPVHLDTVFDLASITKLATTVVVLRLAELGRLDLDRPVSQWLPAARAGALTLRALLTHTGGLPPWSDEVRAAPDPAAAWAVLLDVAPDAPPGREHRYSDLGPILAGGAAVAATGGADLTGGLADLVAELVTGPLGMADTGFQPVSGSEGRGADRVAAVETGYPRGVVHDETARALGGVAGHAGLFGTAADLVRLGEALRTGGGPVLSPDSVAELTRDQTPTLAVSGYRQGLGARLAAPSFMGPLATTAFGHTGFTGTSIVVDPVRELTVVLLTNRVHPTRTGPGVDPTRQAVCALATDLASRHTSTG